MKILLSLTNLQIGGAQLFTILLANELIKQENEVGIYIHQPDYMDKTLILQLNNQIHIYSFCNSNFFRSLLWKLNALSQKLFKFQLVHYLNKSKFKSVVKKFRPHIINSQMTYSDQIIAECLSELNGKYSSKFVITNHGEYNIYNNNFNINNVIKTLNDKALAGKILSGEISSTENDFSKFIQNRKVKHKKILIGFSDNLIPPYDSHIKSHHNIPDDHFIFGMVARGIPEKGWEETINAFIKFNTLFPKTTLLLIGNGQYLKQLMNKYNHLNIHLIQLNNFWDFFKYLHIFNVGLLPSYFKGESCPNILIQFLFYKIPFIATDVALIPQIAGSPQIPCGLLIPLKNNKVNVEDIFQAMKKIYTNKELYNSMKNNCDVHKNKFKIETIAQEYIDFFNMLLHEK